MQKSFFVIIALASSVTLLIQGISSCKKQEKENHLLGLEQVIPVGFPAPNYRFEDNPLSKEGFELGRRLFYDGRLSIDSLHPCASCHQQIAGFGTYEHDRSHGVFNSHTLRNAPILFNLAWNTSYHWDGAFQTLIDEATNPINGHLEMGDNFESVIKKLEDDPNYRREFREVFHYPFIKPEFILKALAQFTGTLISADSKYDRYKRGELAFSASEESGYQLFKTHCATCHPEPMFTDYSLRNIGLPVDNLLNDYGRMMITGRSEDSLKFKVPTLRNVNISANYFHDGRFNTLSQVIGHYRTGVQQSPSLDPQLINGISLTNNESAQIISFLRTLTDSSFLTNPHYAAP